MMTLGALTLAACFTSAAVEAKVAEMQGKIPDAKVAAMFAKCFPNTLETTVAYSLKDGDDDTFVITGDIPAMWLRDSAAQVWPYLPLLEGDDPLRRLVRGVLRRQFRQLIADPYANAFYDDPTRESWWSEDKTVMHPGVHERKYELDSLCYPLRLAAGYYAHSHDATIWDEVGLQALRNILKVMREQQRKQGDVTTYTFARHVANDRESLSNHGYGGPTRPVGLIASGFRPSDDVCKLQFLVPANFFAVEVLRDTAAVLTELGRAPELVADCRALADEVAAALEREAIFEHPQFGRIYAYEVDGFGGRLVMDDPNAPSLLSLRYLSPKSIDPEVYANTRRFVWSEANPYFCRGRVLEGLASPHTELGRVWPMSIIMKGLTSDDKAEMAAALKLVAAADAGTLHVHEAVDKDDPTKFSRAWFAWANTLFGELVLKCYE